MNRMVDRVESWRYAQLINLIEYPHDPGPHARLRITVLGSRFVCSIVENAESTDHFHEQTSWSALADDDMPMVPASCAVALSCRNRLITFLPRDF